MRNSRILYTIILALILLSCSTGKRLNPEITVDQLTDHINYLVSEELQGRLPGTEGDIEAAVYIRDMLKSYGLKPFTGDGFAGV
ncbi:MAG: hypothetical protein R2727_05120 [Bacteroidales bacterium]